MDPRVQVFSIAATGLLLLVILELVRRRRLLERYALLWLFSALVLIGLGLWRGLLEVVAEAIGIRYPPSALFVIAFGFILVLLLHFSIAVSRLADQSKVLAQRLALLEERIREQERRHPGTVPAAAEAESETERSEEPAALGRGASEY
jgi:hypothetical protein